MSTGADEEEEEEEEAEAVGERVEGERVGMGEIGPGGVVEDWAKGAPDGERVGMGDGAPGGERVGMGDRAPGGVAERRAKEDTVINMEEVMEDDKEEVREEVRLIPSSEGLVLMLTLTLALALVLPWSLKS